MLPEVLFAGSLPRRQVVNPELWIFENAATSRMPLWALVHPEIESLLNIPGHGLNRSLVLKLMERLAFQGDIFIEDESGHPRLFAASEMDSLAQRNRHCPQYGLTPAGGARWEGWAGAVWDRYVRCHQLSSREDHEGYYEICTVNRATLEQFIEVYFPYRGDAIVSGTEFWEPLAPWPATYWKVLPSAWRFQCRRSPRPGGHAYEYRQRYQELIRWHRHAWEDPGYR